MAKDKKQLKGHFTLQVTYIAKFIYLLTLL
jgi:hypothetical protein